MPSARKETSDRTATFPCLRPETTSPELHDQEEAQHSRNVSDAHLVSVAVFHNFLFSKIRVGRVLLQGCRNNDDGGDGDEEEDGDEDGDEDDEDDGDEDDDDDDDGADDGDSGAAAADDDDHDAWACMGSAWLCTPQRPRPSNLII